MRQSDESPLSMDIHTVLRFEAQRIRFDQMIIDLCVVCETFWTELSNKEGEYNFPKVRNLSCEISKTIIHIKRLF